MASSLTDIELLARLVAFDSTSRHSNLPIADFICEYFARTPCLIHRNFNDDRSKVNLVIVLPGKGSRAVADAGLTLCGHMDVVPAGEPEWKSDPFQLVEANDRFIARGACDMKGFVALAMNALRHAEHQPVAHPLVLLLTFDEELGTLGAQHFVGTWPRPHGLPRRMIVGEPTSLRIARMHKGHLKLRITTTGRAAHSGYPALGVNAIEPMGRVLVALSQLRETFAADRPAIGRFFPEAPYVVVNPAMLRGGVAINVIPERCELDLGIRVLPGMESAELVRAVRDAVRGIPGVEADSVSILGDSPPLLTDDSNELVRVLCDLVRQSESVGMSYATDAGPLASMGFDCVLWGPGSIDVAHKPNEWLPRDEFVRASDLLSAMIHRFCGQE